MQQPPPAHVQGAGPDSWLPVPLTCSLCSPVCLYCWVQDLGVNVNISPTLEAAASKVRAGECPRSCLLCVGDGCLPATCLPTCCYAVKECASALSAWRSAAAAMAAISSAAATSVATSHAAKSSAATSSAANLLLQPPVLLIIHSWCHACWTAGDCAAVAYDSVTPQSQVGPAA